MIVKRIDSMMIEIDLEDEVAAEINGRSSFFVPRAHIEELTVKLREILFEIVAEAPQSASDYVDERDLGDALQRADPEELLIEVEFEDALDHPDTISIEEMPAENLTPSGDKIHVNCAECGIVVRAGDHCSQCGTVTHV
jgi:hypothetical protein